MKSYVINSDRAPEQFQRIGALFSMQGLELTRLAAVDAKFISNDTYQRLIARHQAPYPLTKKDVAYFLSHRLALQKIAAGPDPFAAVFEDNVTLSSCAYQLLNTINWIPQDADIVKIESSHQKVWLGAPQSISSQFRIARLKSSHITSAGYIISRHAAAQLVSASKYIYHTLDHFLFNFEFEHASKLTIYQLDPAIVVQTGFSGRLPDKRKHVKTQNHTLLQNWRQKIEHMNKYSLKELWGLRINFTTREQWKRIPFDS